MPLNAIEMGSGDPRQSSTPDSQRFPAYEFDSADAVGIPQCRMGRLPWKTRRVCVSPDVSTLFALKKSKSSASDG